MPPNCLQRAAVARHRRRDRRPARIRQHHLVRPAQSAPSDAHRCVRQLRVYDHVTDGRDGDHARVKVTVPENGWTGRFLATGGSAYWAGDLGTPLVRGVNDGYATASTDTGLPPVSPVDTSWGLTPTGQRFVLLLERLLYRWRPRLSPSATISPCLQRNRCDRPSRRRAQFAVAAAWPPVVMNLERTFPRDCEFAAFKDAAIKACGGMDGVTNGVIDQPESATTTRIALSDTSSIQACPGTLVHGLGTR